MDKSHYHEYNSEEDRSDSRNSIYSNGSHERHLDYNLKLNDFNTKVNDYKQNDFNSKLNDYNIKPNDYTIKLNDYTPKVNDYNSKQNDYKLKHDYKPNDCNLKNDFNLKQNDYKQNDYNIKSSEFVKQNYNYHGNDRNYKTEQLISDNLLDLKKFKRRNENTIVDRINVNEFRSSFIGCLDDPRSSKNRSEKNLESRYRQNNARKYKLFKYTHTFRCNYYLSNIYNNKNMCKI